MNAINNSTTIMDCSRQWASRPADERYLSLDDMQQHFDKVRSYSRAKVISNRQLTAQPTEDNKGLIVLGPEGNAFSPTNWAFGQMAQRAKAPAGYLQSIPAPIAADCINYGLKYARDVEDIGVLLQQNGDSILRAVTGPSYGRVWNGDIVQRLRRYFGDGVTGDFKVPGEFGVDVPVTKDNTTLYASDRDMFVFLADEKRRIEIANRRDGKPGSLARGFIVWNSEVGSKTLGIKTFLFDYVCMNRIIWGATDVHTVTIRHTSGAPDRFVEEVAPAIMAYAESSANNVVQAIEDARAKRLDNVDEFLMKRFSKRMSAELQAIHVAEENRPIETLWDVTTAVTAKAKAIPYQDERVELETIGGDIMAMAS